MTEAESGAPPAGMGRRGIARAAGVIGLGNIASRVLGLVRESVIAALFGSSPLANAFVVASQVPTILYDLLIGGMLSSALVPVFSDYASRRDEPGGLWGLASTVLSAAALLLALVTAAVVLLAPQIANLMASGYPAPLRDATATLIRFLSPSIFFFGLSGVFSGLLYALKRFNYAAMGAALYNLGIIVGALVLTRGFEGNGRILGLALGIFLGSVLQMGLLLLDLRDAPLRLQPGRFWQDPGVRRILRLYAPVALSVIVASFGVIIDRRLASFTDAIGTITWMRYATTLIQFPLGLVAAAISLAVLPDLSRYAAQQAWAGYRSTLTMGLRMVLVLIIPATVGLFVLATPIVELLFERGLFGAADTIQTTHALRLYLIGLAFAAVDQLLIFAFYARQDTLTPAVVGIGAIGVYLAVALPLLVPLQMSALVLANAAQHMAHALVMLLLIQRGVGGLSGGRLLQTLPRILLAALLMGGAVWITLGLLPASGIPLLDRLLRVFVPALAGGALYAFLAGLLDIEEARALMRLARARIGR